jgi:hypothetical protein
MAAAIIDASRKTPEADKAPAAGPLSAEELRKMHAYWRAANYLAVGQIYLMDNPLLPEGAVAAQARQAAPARPLGHHVGPELPLRPPQPGHQGVRPEHALHLRPRARRAGAGGQRLPRRDVQRGLPQHRQDEAGLKRLFTQFSFPGGNGFSHQDPGFIDYIVNKKAEVSRVCLPPDANTLLSVTDHRLCISDLLDEDLTELISETAQH